MKKYIFPFLFLSIFFASCSKEKRSYRAGIKMKEWIKEISNYTKQKKPGFIIIPQNGIELATKELDANSELDMDYLNHIDALTVEELFYFNTFSPDSERLALLDRLVSHKKIIVSEMVSNYHDIPHAYQLNMQHGFIPFVRGPNNYMYEYIPDTIVQENNDNIESIQEVRNVLYYIGGSNKFTNKEDYLESIRQTNFDLVIIDLFFNDTPLNSDDIKALRHKKNGGKRLVIAYVSIGSAERYRYYWKNNWRLHHPCFIRKPYPGYPDEYYVKFWDNEWKEIIMGSENSYIDKIIQAGFDGAFLDNVEVYYYLYYDE
ncbi:MAG: endo alpha-1,4 polygalactosaminidase [Bacteroidales bacterium]|nr:endo alpha-1,4 polygalactosaminidase [Bacteroidales bacterium]